MKCAAAALVATLACATTSFAFDAPAGIAVDGAGSVYVTNAGSSGYVAVYDPYMQRIGSLGGLTTPTSVAVDSRGRVFVGDFSQNRVVVYAPGQSVPGGFITQYVSQPIHVRIGSYDEIWIENATGQLHTFEPNGNFMNGLNSWGDVKSFAIVGPNVMFVGSGLDGGNSRLTQNALGVLLGTSPSPSFPSTPFAASDIAYDFASATVWFVDRTRRSLTTLTNGVFADAGLTLGSPPYAIALDVAGRRVYVVEPGQNQVEVFDLKAHRKIGVLL